MTVSSLGTKRASISRTSAQTGTKVLRQICVHHSAKLRVPFRFFQQRHADPADHAAKTLAVGKLWIDHAANVISADDARDAHRAEIRVHMHFCKNSAEGVGGKSLLFFARFGASLRIQSVKTCSSEAGPPDRQQSTPWLWASAFSFARNARQAARTALPTLAMVVEPPCSWAFGSAVSPSSKRTWSAGRPSASAATWVMDV